MAPFIPLIYFGVGIVTGLVGGVVYKAKKRDERFIEALEKAEAKAFRDSTATKEAVVVEEIKK